jgi:hypothetical protein
MARFILCCAVVSLTSAAAISRASEEMIHPWKKVSLVADGGGSGFGDVTVTAEGSIGAAAMRVTSLAVKVQGKTITIPSKALQDLPGLQLHSLEVRSERGYDKDPWLYVVFKLWRPKRPASITSETVHFAIQGGKFVHRSVTAWDTKHQSKYEKKSF